MNILDNISSILLQCGDPGGENMEVFQIVSHITVFFELYLRDGIRDKTSQIL